MLEPQSLREKPCVGSVSACAWGPALLREAEAAEAGVYGRISPAPVIASRPTFSGAPATTAGSGHPSSPRTCQAVDSASPSPNNPSEAGLS